MDGQGYVLIVVLIFLQVCSSLGVYELSAVLNHMQLNRDRWQKFQVRKHAKQLLARCESELLGQSEDHLHCQVEELEWDGCAMIAGDMINQLTSVQYYRITLYSSDKNMAIKLQSTLARPSPLPISCAGTRHIVTSGRQMLREIYE